MKYHPCTAALALIVLCAAAVNAQTPAGAGVKQPRGSKPPAAVRTAAADPLAETRRTNAIALISSLADEARGFKDETLRARVQARAADALWDIDKDKARTLFRRAWDAAEAADREADRKDEAERQRQQQASGGSAFAWNTRPRLRPEVLRLAAKRERALGEEFLSKLDEARKQEQEATDADRAA